ncbi:MAG: hypothetical protein L3K04_00455 [Thermoplasmata archaeon]|nr:hypothetical protein [Thermoplasmata archaeon]MCI4337917.1 hypothetical protein [Thermoplasmata archaeon]
MRRIALATSPSLPTLAEDDQLLIPALAHLDLIATACVWSDPAIDWASFDAAVIRSTWDYHRRAPEYLAWAESVQRQTRLYNAYETVRWNSHKSYLARLGTRGVPVLPDVVGHPDVSLEQVLRERMWTRAVVKPAVSADADGTFLVTTETARALEDQYRAALATGEQLIQPYVEEIETGGEHSLFYFDGAYSHAVRRPPGLVAKTPNAPRATPYEPVPEERRIADQVTAEVRPVPLYARVDLVVRESGSPVLMELELIEPHLYFGWSPGAADRMAAAIRRRLS